MGHFFCNKISKVVILIYKTWILSPSVKHFIVLLFDPTESVSRQHTNVNYVQLTNMSQPSSHDE